VVLVVLFGQSISQSVNQSFVNLIIQSINQSMGKFVKKCIFVNTFGESVLRIRVLVWQI